MQEVFEKIIEKLEEECFLTTNDDGETNELSIKVVDLNDAIEIVKQTAAEYNNGWILCSERMPEEPKITSTDAEYAICGGMLSEYIVMIDGAESPAVLYYCGNSRWYDEVSGEYYKVIAWQPLPAPYQPHQREEKE